MQIKKLPVAYGKLSLESVNNLVFVTSFCMIKLYILKVGNSNDELYVHYALQLKVTNIIYKRKKRKVEYRAQLAC